MSVLSSPTHAVIGSADLDAQCRFLETFGFRQTAQGTLSGEAAAALYGLSSELEERTLGMAESSCGWIRLVSTPEAAVDAGPYDHRPLAIDLYTRDIHRSLELAAGAGAHCRPMVEYSVGPLLIKEAEVIGPDGLVLVFIEVDPRRPSLLDRTPGKLHSEVHSIVWTVGDAEEALPTWTQEAGLSVLIDAPIGGPTISKLLGLPRPEVPVRFILMCDEDQNPARFELIQFTEDPGETLPTLPLTPGLHAPAFSVPDLDAAMAALPSVEFGETVRLDGGLHAGERAVSGLAPGGVRFELWQA